jgi:predicted short-subunit dehydrogenase-like oxidoreductase (DUF2520 family)
MNQGIEHGDSASAVRPGVVWIVGGGRVGTSLAIALVESGVFADVRLIGRTAEPSPVWGSRPGYHSTGDDPVPARLPAADRVQALVLSIPDDPLPSVAASWATALADHGVRVEVALHTSGFRPAEALSDLRDSGAAVGSWHPLLALAGPRRDAFRGVTIGLEGDDAALGFGGWMARSVGARWIRVLPQHKALYHTAAVFGSNFLVASLAVAARLLEQASEQQVGIEDLLPLARSAIENLTQSGIVEGATGPIVRGDHGTVAGHLEALDRGTASLYRALATELLIAAGDRVNPETALRIGRLLGDTDADEAQGDSSG